MSEFSSATDAGWKINANSKPKHRRLWSSDVSFFLKGWTIQFIKFLSFYLCTLFFKLIAHLNSNLDFFLKLSISLFLLSDDNDGDNFWNELENSASDNEGNSDISESRFSVKNFANNFNLLFFLHSSVKITTFQMTTTRRSGKQQWRKLYYISLTLRSGEWIKNSTRHFFS